jgi:hypothetical protein
MTSLQCRILEVIEPSESKASRLFSTRDFAKKIAEQVRGMIESLRFAGMKERENDISTAQAGSFEWIYQDAMVSYVPYDNFIRWIDSEAPVYW